MQPTATAALYFRRATTEFLDSNRQPCVVTGDGWPDKYVGRCGVCAEVHRAACLAPRMLSRCLRFASAAAFLSKTAGPLQTRAWPCRQTGQRVSFGPRSRAAASHSKAAQLSDAPQCMPGATGKQGVCAGGAGRACMSRKAAELTGVTRVTVVKIVRFDRAGRCRRACAASKRWWGTRTAACHAHVRTTSGLQAGPLLLYGKKNVVL